MEVLAVVERVAGVDLAVADAVAVEAMFRDLGRLQAWVDGRRLGGLRRLEELKVPLADAVVTEACRDSSRETNRSVRRARTVGFFPGFEKAMDAGEVTASHLDALTSALADVPKDKRPLLLDTADALLDAARHQLPDAFTSTVRDVVRALLNETDASARHDRQCRAARLRHWTDKVTGMLRLHGQFDPVTGAQLAARLDGALSQLFPDHTNLPDTCPEDPADRQDHLRALTLAHLLLHPDAPGWRPEVLLVTDEHTVAEGYHEASIVDIGAEVDVSLDVLRRLVDDCKIVPILMRDGVVTSVAGRTDLDRGRTSRLADLDQRRALRAMYPTCAIPDCPVRFRNCHIHHLRPWDDGGGTDLDDLLPLCSRHHHAVHDSGWMLTLDPTTRRLSVTRPDGTRMTTGPPHARTAA